MTTPRPSASALNFDRLTPTNLRDGAGNQSFNDLTLLAAQVCDCDLAFVVILGRGNEPSAIVARSLDLALGPACISLVTKAMSLSPSERVVAIEDVPAASNFAHLSEQVGRELTGETTVPLGASRSDGRGSERAAERPDDPSGGAIEPVRFFCGVRLLTPTHLDVGVLCVLDTETRTLGQRQRQSLQALGRQATGTLRSLQAFGASLSHTQTSEIPPPQESPRLDFDTILRSLPSYQSIVDILERVTDALFAVDENWKLNYLNTYAQQRWQLDRKSAIGRELWSCLPEWRGTDLEACCRAAARSQRAQKFKHYDVTLETWLEVRVYPSPGRISIYLHDVELPNYGDLACDLSLERAHTSALVTAVSAALGQSQPLEQSLELCANALENNLAATSVGIWLLDLNLRSDTDSAKAIEADAIEKDPTLEDHSRLNLVARSGVPFPHELFPTTVRWQEDANAWIARTPYPYCINSRDFEPEDASGDRLRAVVCYPLVVESRPIGVLVLGSSHALPDSSHDILTWVANGTAIAVDRIWARDTLASRRKSLLFSLANQIRNTLELDTILSTAVREIRSLLKVDRCYYIWCAIEGDATVLAVTHEDAEPGLDSWIGELPPREEARLAESIANLKSLYIDNINAEDDETRAVLESLGIVSQLAIPLGTRAGQFGAVVCAHGKEARTWTHGEVELLHAAVDQLAIAIDQAELYAKTCAAARAAETQARKLQDAMRNLKKTEAQLVQNEKMSSLGQMVAGIAHEINNPVNFISGNLTHANNYINDLLGLIELYQEKYPEPDDDITEEIEEIDLEFLQDDLPRLLKSMRMGADRIREIVLSLRNFSRLDEADMKPVKIEDGIDSTLLILQSRLKANSDSKEIEIVKNYANLPPVDCFPGSLNQVFMNLIANAIDAEDKQRKSEAGEPAITITTEALGHFVRISVADNGSGIPESLVKQLFDPFFTTKPVGKGTGLGLSISYQIVVEQHGGRFWCESEEGVGTTFFVEIPIRQREDEGIESTIEKFREFLDDPMADDAEDDDSEDSSEDSSEGA